MSEDTRTNLVNHIKEMLNESREAGVIDYSDEEGSLWSEIAQLCDRTIDAMWDSHVSKDQTITLGYGMDNQLHIYMMVKP